jgi:hypothetical protein
MRILFITRLGWVEGNPAKFESGFDDKINNLIIFTEATADRSRDRSRNGAINQFV